MRTNFHKDFDGRHILLPCKSLPIWYVWLSTNRFFNADVKSFCIKRVALEDALCLIFVAFENVFCGLQILHGCTKNYFKTYPALVCFCISKLIESKRISQDKNAFNIYNSKYLLNSYKIRFSFILKLLDNLRMNKSLVLLNKLDMCKTAPILVRASKHKSFFKNSNLTWYSI